MFVIIQLSWSLCLNSFNWVHLNKRHFFLFYRTDFFTTIDLLWPEAWGRVFGACLLLLALRFVPAFAGLSPILGDPPFDLGEMFPSICCCNYAYSRKPYGPPGLSYSLFILIPIWDLTGLKFVFAAFWALTSGKEVVVVAFLYFNPATLFLLAYPLSCMSRKSTPPTLGTLTLAFETILLLTSLGKIPLFLLNQLSSF